MQKEIKSNITAMLENGQYSEAQMLLKDYFAIIKDDPEAYSMQAVLYIVTEKLEEARLALLEGLEFETDNFDLLYNLAYVYEKQRNWVKAKKNYELALRHCSDQTLLKGIEVIINEIQKYLDAEQKLLRKVLFAQSVPDVRTHKIASVLHEKGVIVDVLYAAVHPQDTYKGMKLPYQRVYRMETINDTLAFINASDYDVIFSCNEPDFISALLVGTNKPVIHDCHDMMSLRSGISIEQHILEYIANSRCDGNIYVTDLVEEIARGKFDLESKPVFLCDNYVLKNQLPKKFLPKLSLQDGELHCVYEGGFSNAEGHHRSIAPLFMKFAKQKIHVHYYTGLDHEYYREVAKQSPYLHYEGTKEPSELIEAMTQYDVGLTLLNVTDVNRTFLNTTFPNKAWDYLAAGLPILFSELKPFQRFVKKFAIGNVLKPQESIREQVLATKNIEISKTFLSDSKLCMDDFADELIEFLLLVKKSKLLKE